MDLPAPFHSQPGASMTFGRRSLVWTLDSPGTLFRNRFWRATIEVSEVEPWRGEPLFLSADRAQEQFGGRSQFTDAGRAAISDMVVPVVAAYGFDRAWTEAHRGRLGHAAEGAAAGEQEALRLVEWWRMQAELIAAHEAGDIALIPVAGRPRPSPVRILSRWGCEIRREAVSAEAMLDGERVGWLTSRGQLVPEDAVLDPVLSVPATRSAPLM